MEEKGLLYSVPDTIFHQRNLYQGFLVGWYHDPNIKISDKCLENDRIVDDFAYIMKMVFMEQNLLHVLELIKLTEKTVLVLRDTFEYCGYKQIILDLREFCSID